MAKKKRSTWYSKMGIRYNKEGAKNRGNRYRARGWI